MRYEQLPLCHRKCLLHEFFIKSVLEQMCSLQTDTASGVNSPDRPMPVPSVHLWNVPSSSSLPRSHPLSVITRAYPITEFPADWT